MGIDVQMLVKNKGKALTKKQVLGLSFDICEAFGTDHFWVNQGKDGFEPQHALEIVDEFGQDGDSIYPKYGEQLIQVNTTDRYYGEGYERGPFPTWYMVAKWLEVRIPNSEVYYGGDSSGVLAEKFDDKRREKMFRHFAKVGGKPYRGGRSILGDGLSRYCDFCETQMSQYGFGQNYGGFVCYGCGLNEETHDNGKTWGVVKED